MHRRFGVVLDEELMPSSGSGPVWNVHCFGNEMTIAECVHGGWTRAFVSGVIFTRWTCQSSAITVSDGTQHQFFIDSILFSVDLFSSCDNSRA